MGGDSHEALLSVIVSLHGDGGEGDAALRSLVDQTLWRRGDVEMVLLDCGAEATGAICERYLRDYPDAVKLCPVQGIGEAAAFDAGIRVASGRYLVFATQDVVWSPDALERAGEYLLAHPDTVIAAARISKPDAKDGLSGLDHRFTSTRMVNIFEERNTPLLSMYGTFVRKAALEDELPLSRDPRVDHEMASRLVLKIGAYAILSECACEYRGAGGGVFPFGGCADGQAMLLECLKNCEGIRAASRKAYGYLTPYAQYAAMHELALWMQSAGAGKIPPAEKSGLMPRLQESFQAISNQVILKQRGLGMPWKLYALSVKRDCPYRDVQADLRLSDGKVHYRKTVLDWADFKPRIVIDSVFCTSDSLYLEGTVRSPFPKDQLTLVLSWGSDALEPELYDAKEPCLRTPFGEPAGARAGFFAKLPRTGSRSLSCAVRVEGKAWQDVAIAYARSSGLRNAAKSRSIDAGGGLLTVVSSTELRYEHRPDVDDALKEERARKKQLVQAEGRMRGARISSLRIEALRSREGRRERVWLISDTREHAGGRGEALFSYLCKVKPEGVAPYFAIAKDSPDYARMNAHGPVVALGSEAYEQLFLRAEYLISSSSEKWVTQCFGSDEKLYADLYSWKYVFLGGEGGEKGPAAAAGGAWLTMAGCMSGQADSASSADDGYECLLRYLLDERPGSRTGSENM